MPSTSADDPAEFSVGVTSSRIVQVSPAARVVHKVILRSIAATGRVPDAATLADAAPTGHQLGVLLGEMHDKDVIRLDDHGKIRAAYPFSAIPTPHVVTIEGGPTVYAMCAIDALGIADMLNRDIAIASTDPVAGEQIQVAVQNGQPAWRPETAVVFVGTDDSVTPNGRDCCSSDTAHQPHAPAADRCCGVMNFFSSRATAHAWLAAHPRASGDVLRMAQAMRLGADIFGRLLDD